MFEILCFVYMFGRSIFFFLSVIYIYREYCKHLQMAENNTQFLADFLSLMVEISPESEDCE